MTDDRDASGEPDDDTPHAGDGTRPSRQESGPHDRFAGLDAFSGIQRQLAAIDFTALTAAQRSIEQATAFKIPQILAAQDAVAKHFAQSIDFSHLGSIHRALIDANARSAATAGRTRWADSLAKAVDFSALHDSIASSSALTAFHGTDKALTALIQRQSEVFAHMESVALKLPAIDVAQWFVALDRWIPVNLRDVEDLVVVAEVALAEGLPLSWVPRPEIVVALVSAGTPEERRTILVERTTDILDDCEAALSASDNEGARQCRNAIGALRAGFDAPAQSHASNIIDSVVLALHGERGRDEARKRAESEFDDDLPLQLAAENLTLRPLFRAFTAWWPKSGETPPDHFARHATSHAVGHVGIFEPLSALIAVMLATSLTVQYAPDESVPTVQLASIASQSAVQAGYSP